MKIDEFDMLQVLHRIATVQGNIEAAKCFVDSQNAKVILGGCILDLGNAWEDLIRILERANDEG